MWVRIAAVGKVKERGVRATLDEYYGRIGHYARFKEVELKDGDAGQVGARFAKAIPDRSRVVALEVDGGPWSSMQLAKFLGECENRGVQSAVFLIGGSHGLPSEVSKKADVRLSLSRMTLPHRLARLFLAEQIYRGFTILRGEPYNH